MAFSCLLFPWTAGFAHALDAQAVRDMIAAFKTDPRGPYQAIRWFCPDGSVIPADRRCAKPGGVQHAVVKDSVRLLAEKDGVYLSPILTGLSFEDFWDAENRQSRVKQYQMVAYLQQADDGWIFRRARFYRGAVQYEDEEAWGRDFLQWLLTQDEALAGQYFFVRRAVRDIPHGLQADRWGAVRAVSKTISEQYPLFMDLRVKLHGRPDPEDREKVRAFYAAHMDTLSPDIRAMFDRLTADMAAVYARPPLETLAALAERLPAGLEMREPVKQFVRTYSAPTADSTIDELNDIAVLLMNIRKSVLSVASPGTRLTLLDLSNELERLFFMSVQTHRPDTLQSALTSGFVMGKALTGCGFLELWEWDHVRPLIFPVLGTDVIGLEQFGETAAALGRMVEWGAGMARATYDPVIRAYAEFEPLARGYPDDQVRSSLLLPLGMIAGKLDDILARKAGVTGSVMGRPAAGRVRGLNPGYAKAELVAVSGDPDAATLLPDKIYAVSRPPADMKPVAGILAVAEGNLASHIQLLARNLGIPNAAVSPEALKELSAFSGRAVFFAVSPGGTVILKPAADMTEEEKRLTDPLKQPDDKMTAPTEKLDLKRTTPLPLSGVRAADSGRICGPKAANLGQLKQMFPDKVGEGLVIPFGVFRMHMDQPMPGKTQSYWGFLTETFARAADQRKAGTPVSDIEKAVLARLAELREAVKTMPFLTEFTKKIEESFVTYLGRPVGRIPVFIRSDTNMEDLKAFTGAGLNLTVFNVVDREKIFQGIRDVWASPYSERSYQWRQRALRNPESVFPSILILPTVNVEKSGVMITTGVTSSDPRDVTVAFSRGPGGAVEGQAAETYLLGHDGTDILLSPAREHAFNILPETGGVEKGYAQFDRPVLNDAELAALRRAAREIAGKLPTFPGIDSRGPFDVELGFLGGDIRLFQARPYVENRRARSTAYLNALDPPFPKAATVDLTAAFE